MKSILATITITMLIATISGCSKKGELSVDDGDEESNVELTLTDTYDKVRNGARLILSYDAQSNSFKGTVENTTNETLEQVRVEVHLSNGKELGPTTPGDLAPEEKRDVQLTATSKNFDRWTAHPEVGRSEHGNREGRGEHDREDGEHRNKEGRSEHDREGGEHKREGKSEHK